MRTIRERWRIPAVLLLGAAALLAPACRHREPSPPPPPLGPLVSVPVLRDHLRRPDPPLVLDTRRPGDYGTGHLPGAVNLPLEDLGRVPDRGLDPLTRERIRRRLVDAGVRPGLPVVTVDEGSPRGFARAAALCWVLSLAGHRDCHVLEGGVAAWRRARAPLVTPRFVPVQKGSPHRIPARPPTLATLDDVRRATAEGETALLDLRDPSAPGAIPGSLHLPLAPLLAEDGRLDHSLLLREATAAGVLAETEIIVLGDDLPRGAAGWFLLDRVLGLRGARLFPGGFDRYLSWPLLPGARTLPPGSFPRAP